MAINPNILFWLLPQIFSGRYLTTSVGLKLRNFVCMSSMYVNMSSSTHKLIKITRRTMEEVIRRNAVLEKDHKHSLVLFAFGWVFDLKKLLRTTKNTHLHMKILIYLLINGGTYMS